ncbi:MAG TPA: hypothetical protein ENI17_12655 [Pseudomonas xinjiangensis]|uniref:Uncharacterized protein n=2 Tax=root TaxID=1 RepID=A0A7V1FT03_9GAMM|nr:hypothetical protein [Halopseudomonas xinjiangensis]HEC48462.1 hypothetical protein [Halopseudomonas xinjiangensis]
MSITNDYSQAEPIERGLYVVLMQDQGWSLADGPGTQLAPPDELELAGYHLPVRFESYDQAAQAGKSGPHEWFDIKPGSPWVEHCLAAGGTYCPDYEKKLGPDNLASRSG